MIVDSATPLITSSWLIHDFFRPIFLRWVVVEQKQMSLAFDRSLGLRQLPVEEVEAKLNVTVVFTTVDQTIGALKKAGELAQSLGARITLIVPQIVPFPLPLTSPPVLLDFQEKRFREIAESSPVDITVKLYLCRDGMETLSKVLSPHSLIVVGGRKRIWPTLAQRLARRLRKAGHEVIFTER